MTRNLVSGPEDAWFEMFATAKDQAALKAHAGLDARGRKNTHPVLHYTLSWAHGEQPSEAHMKETALSSLKAMGLSEHQAVIAAHSDKQHLHLHVVVNTVHPYTGRTADLKFTKLEFSRWAEAYERAHGIHCEQRIHNNEDRQALKVLRAAEKQAGSEPSAYVPVGDRSPHRTAWLDRRALAAGLSVKAGDPVERVLKGLTRHDATFTRQDLARMVGVLTSDAQSFQSLLTKVETNGELVRLAGTERFSTRTMVRAEAILAATADAMAADHSHPLAAKGKRIQKAAPHLTPGQREALAHITGPEAMACVVGYAGTGKSTMLATAKEAWEASGYTVRGAALSGIAAEGLEQGSGIRSSTLHALQWGLENKTITFTAKDVLVIDEAGMVGSRQMQQVVSAARLGGAKVVLVGDPEQLQAIEAGAAFRSLSERVGTATISEVMRQREVWQRQATMDLASGRTGDAINAYGEAGALKAYANREQATQGLIAAWAQELQEGRSAAVPSLILAATRLDVAMLNSEARAVMREAGKLGEDRSLTAVEETIDQPPRNFPLKLAVGERLLFTRNNAKMGVRNGTIGTLEAFGAGTLVVRLDGPERRRVVVDLAKYRNITHGYAMTVHKAQGVTVDRAHVLAGRSMDRNMAYVALSRHRDAVTLHYGQDQFRDREALIKSLSRQRVKDSTLDYMAAQLAQQIEVAATTESVRTPAPLSMPVVQLSRAEQIRRQMGAWRRSNGERDFGMEL